MLLLTNGTIATMDPARPMAEAAVVDGAYFAYVGGRADAEDFARRFSRGAWETLDLQGRFVMPGFNDSHLHFIHYVKTKLSVNLFGCTSLAEVQERLRRGLAGLEAGSGRWLLGEGWNQEQFTGERRFPTRRELDQVSTEYPILILRSCFHVGALNSRALELLHINRDTVGHYGAFAEVDETGAPNGVVKENVLDDIKAAIPSVGLSPLMEQVVQSQHDLLAEGLTSIQSDDFKYAPDEEPYALMDGLRELAERGALKLRFAEQALLTEPETLEEFFTRGGACFGGGDRFRISTVKLLADGSLGARTAFLREPYSDAPDTCGLPIYPEQAQLDRLVVTAHRHNMAVAIHAIGDGAAEMVLNAFQRARAELPWLHPRHGMVHCQILSEGQLRRMAELEAALEEARARRARLEQYRAAEDGRVFFRREEARPYVFLEEDIILEKEIDFLLKKLEHRHQDYLKIIGSQCMGAAVDEEWLSRGVYNHFSRVFFLTEPGLPHDDALPAGEYACLYYRGAYDRLEEHCGVLLAGIAAAGRRPAGPPLELYRVDAHDTNREEEYVTELQMRVE